ncbi:hypothetical protein E4U53_006956 [Claviceps sorghi]|nr:hypothetical protein E4U53_006956 [Claviceps sorghi]
MTTNLATTPSGHSAASAPAAKVKSAPTTSQSAYPHGHLGHLSEREEDALDKLKRLLEEGGLWTRGPPASHDDQTLLRFLRARRWVAQDAYKQFKDTEEWRAANHIDTLYRTIDLDAFEQSRQLYPQWTGRRDRRGTPVFVFDVKKLDSKTISDYERRGAKSTFSDARTDGKTPPGLLRLFALYENLTRFTQPLCTQLQDRDHAEVPITMSINIVDITGVGLKQFWNLKGHMQAASQLATAHYPETLDSIFIVGAPFFFSTVWSWVRRWFDPMTMSKFHVLAPHEVLPTLERFMDPADIPKKYGGGLDYTFGQPPVADPAWDGVIAWEKGISSFPPGPLLWEEEDDDDDDDDGEQARPGREPTRKRLVCVATGKEKGKPRSQRICSVPKVCPPAPDQISSQASSKSPRDASFASSTDQHTRSHDDSLSDGSETTVHTDEALTNGDLVGNLKLEGSNAVHLPSATPAAIRG